jgi:hypothetical protein
MRFHGLPFAKIINVALPGALGLAALVVGCSSSGGDASNSDGGSGAELYCAPVDTCPPDVSGVDLTTPVVSFQKRCSDTYTCHGSPPASGKFVAGLDLGPHEGTPSDDDVANIVADLINKPPTIGPADGHNVVPGDWTKSFLMTKVDGCQNDDKLDCPGTAAELDDLDATECTDFATMKCGRGMPNYGSDADSKLQYPLGADDRTTIRRWIQQGAKAN